MFRILSVVLMISSALFASVKTKIIQSSQENLVIQVVTNPVTTANLFPSSLLIGLPSLKLPKTQIRHYRKSPNPFPRFNKESETDFEWHNLQILQNLPTAVLEIDPKTEDGNFYEIVEIHLQFDPFEYPSRIPTPTEARLLANRILNWNTAKDWLLPEKRRAKKVQSFPPGKWISFELLEDGMKVIQQETLENIIPSIPGHDPRAYMLFMSAELGRYRSQSVNLPIADNLVEIGIDIEGESDGSFDIEDRIIFYGRGPSGYELKISDVNWNQNLYFTTNTCWLFLPDDNSLRGKRVETASVPESASLTLDYGLSFYHLEIDLINPEVSGLRWVGNSIPASGSQIITAILPNPKSGVDANVTVQFMGHSSSETSSANHIMELRHNSSGGIQVGNTLSWTGTGIRSITGTIPGGELNSGNNAFYIQNNSNDGNSAPYFDFFDIQYGRLLDDVEAYEFFAPATGQKVRFTFAEPISSTTRVWNITNPEKASLATVSNLVNLEVILPTDTLARFAVFNLNSLTNVESLEYQPNTVMDNLRNQTTIAEYIIVGPKSFQTAVQPLLNLRNPSRYANLEDIYREYSAGNRDPMAIRSFLQWTQENWQEPKPFCALLLGDGGYDYRNITGESSIIVPTIQVQAYRSYATDDRLATLYGNIPEIALGRYPAKNVEQVDNFVDKIIALESEPEFGPWRQKVTLVADDAARPEPSHGGIATGKSHTLNSEEIAEIIPSTVNVQKLYMMEYPEVSDASAYGVIKPDATQALFDILARGTAILNYIGHGSAYQLAQEKLLHMDRGDLNRIETGRKMPLWIVGTCSFGHFDDPLTESFAEELIREPMNAASAVISTSRPITVTGNERYIQELFNAVFSNNQVSNQPIGVILQSIKNGSNESEYFHLFGDPAMGVPMPTDTLDITGITPDTLRTLETAIFTGSQDIIIESGVGINLLTDAVRQVTREYNIASTTESLTYTLPGAILFRGLFDFSGSELSSEIRVPQDISYSENPARIMVYIHNDSQEALGALNGIPLRGGDPSLDHEGPIISFETGDGRLLRSGDHLGSDQDLILRLSDPIGINLTNEVGHEVLLTDRDSGETMDATSDFYYDINSITTGTIPVAISNREKLELYVKVWDNANNPSEMTIMIHISERSKLRLYNTYNYPNPFSAMTQFTFELSAHAEISLQVYTLGGRKIREFEAAPFSAGFHTIDWDGRDAFGGELANGVYLYKLKAEGPAATDTFIGRCAKFR